MHQPGRTGIKFPHHTLRNRFPHSLLGHINCIIVIVLTSRSIFLSIQLSNHRMYHTCVPGGEKIGTVAKRNRSFASHHDGAAGVCTTTRTQREFSSNFSILMPEIVRVHHVLLSYI